MTLKEIEQQLAERQARDIILALPAEVIEGRVWRNTTDQNCAWEVKYLRMRGLLMHNPAKPYLVVVRSTT